jgi:hypothetical protein
MTAGTPERLSSRFMRNEAKRIERQQQSLSSHYE